MSNSKTEQLRSVEIFYGDREYIADSINSVQDAHTVFGTIWPKDLNQIERVCVLAVDAQNRPYAFRFISQGGQASTVCDAKNVFEFGLAVGAMRLFVCHNHPSGNLNPSESDIRVAKRLQIVGEALAMKVLDNLIITEQACNSVLN